MKKYEYRLLQANGGFFSGPDLAELTGRLNSLGQQGWEIVSVVNTAVENSLSPDLLITLKREQP